MVCLWVIRVVRAVFIEDGLLGFLVLLLYGSRGVDGVLALPVGVEGTFGANTCRGVCCFFVARLLRRFGLQVCYGPAGMFRWKQYVNCVNFLVFGVTFVGAIGLIMFWGTVLGLLCARRLMYIVTGVMPV